MDNKEIIVKRIEIAISNAKIEHGKYEPQVKDLVEKSKDPKFRENAEIGIIHIYTVEAEISAMERALEHINKIDEEDGKQNVLFDGKNILATCIFTAEKHRRKWTALYRKFHYGSTGYAELVKTFAKYTGMVSGYAIALSFFRIIPDYVDVDIPF